MAIETKNTLGVESAIGILRQMSGKFGKRHNYTHDDAALDNVHRLRALEGICGQCPNLRLESIRCFGRQLVEVRCNRRYSPLEMYRRTELGETPKCPGLDDSN